MAMSVLSVIIRTSTITIVRAMIVVCVALTRRAGLRKSGSAGQKQEYERFSGGYVGQKHPQQNCCTQMVSITGHP